MKKTLFLTTLLFLVIVLIMVGFYFYRHFRGTNQIMSKLEKKALSTASPNAGLFYTMTIPYLRSRNYTSSLGSLQEVENNSAYTGYLTSYDSDGLKVNGLLTKPKGDMPQGGWPAIIFVHGYIPPNQYQTLTRYVNYVDYLAKNGFVVFKIDLRGNGNSEGTPSGAYFSSDYVIDTLNAYAAIGSANFVNSQKIGLWGHSMAGNIVMRAFAAKPNIPAVVIWAGAVYSYSDLLKYGIHDESYHPSDYINKMNQIRRLMFEKEGSPSAQSAFWRQVAPIYYLNDLKGAIEIQQAEDDTTVNIGYSRELVSLLNKTNVPHEYFEYPVGGHNIASPSFDLAMQRTVEFYKKYLGR